MKFNAALRRASKFYAPRSTTQSAARYEFRFCAQTVRNLREIAARREGRCEAELATCYFCGADGVEFCDFKILAALFRSRKHRRRAARPRAKFIAV